MPISEPAPNSPDNRPGWSWFGVVYLIVISIVAFTLWATLMYLSMTR